MAGSERHRTATTAAARAATLAAVLVTTAAVAAAAAGPVPAQASDPAARGDQSVTLRQGTNLTAAAAPDGSTVIDLHGLLFRVPADGGTARQLTDVDTDAAQPDVAADGRLAFQAYADGRFHIWTAKPDGSDSNQLTDGAFDDREPVWSPDGQTIAFSSDRAGSYDIWTVDVSTGKLTRWTDDPGTEYDPTWHPGGDRLAYVDDGAINASTAGAHPQTLIPAPDGDASLHAPAWAPDGNRVAYVRLQGTQADLMVEDQQVTDGQDVFLFSPDWTGANRLRYTADGKIRTTTLGGGNGDIGFEADITIPALSYEKKNHGYGDQTPRQVQALLTPTLSPDGNRVAFVALNDLWVMPIGGRPHKVTDDHFQEVDPAWSRDGSKLAYSSDRAGTEDIYVRDLATGNERQVTALDGAEVSAAFSPSGDRIAFQDHNGATHVADLSSGRVREVVAALFGPGRPSWSADGSTLALAAVKPYSRRFREGTSQILTVDVTSGELTYQPPGARHLSLSTRGDDGPVWSPDGEHMAFVVNSTLRVLPVDAAGNATGPARVVNDDVADAPTWSGDSEHLLYLSNGKLRLADVDTGTARTLDVPLSYRPDVATGRTVVHAGAFWDGKARQLRRDVDIVVVGNRISSVQPHTDAAHHGEVIDASEQTVMPGLMDSHVHQAYQSRFYGDRQGRISLAYGLTSTMSVGDQVYRAMEDREALRAGERVGPRFYATGEPIDGSRVYYNFMRPTTSDAQVTRELSRAKALDYDMLKTYVRLPADRMRQVIETAHDLGLTSASHYLSPGAQLGQDGTTHLAATQRLGYARTITATGRSYADVPALYGAGKRTVSATLFSYDFLYADEVASDPRLALLPPWKQQALLNYTRGNTGPPSDPDCSTPACREAQTLRRIEQAGGEVLAGTDSPLVEVGVSLHANLRELVGYGWDEYDALRTATVNAAQNLGVADQVGTLEEGKLADLVAVNGNPLRDIDAAMDVQLTMVGGQAYTQDELMRPFTDRATAQAAAGARAQQPESAPAAATEVSTPAAPRAGRFWWHAPAVVAEAGRHACDAYGDLYRWHRVDPHNH